MYCGCIENASLLVRVKFIGHIWPLAIKYDEPLYKYITVVGVWCYIKVYINYIEFVDAKKWTVSCWLDNKCRSWQCKIYLRKGCLELHLYILLANPKDTL